MDQRFTDDVEGLYRRLDCPVTVLWGQQDAWIPFQKGKALAALIAHANLTLVPNAGRLVQEDCPEAIIAAALKLIG